jgi:hypothetical protein
MREALRMMLVRAQKRRVVERQPVLLRNYFSVVTIKSDEVSDGSEELVAQVPEL